MQQPPGYPPHQGHGAPPGYGQAQPQQWQQPGAPGGYGAPPGYGQPGLGQLGAFGGQPDLGAPKAGAAPRTGVRMSAGLYLFFMIGGVLIGALLTAWGATDSAVTELLMFSWIPMLIGVIASYVFIYRQWKAIDDGQARTGPGKAVGLLFVPFFNIYWIINIFCGWPTDYNNYVRRYGIQAPQLSQGLWIGALVALAVFPIIGVFVYAYVVVATCRAVNALPA